MNRPRLAFIVVLLALFAAPVRALDLLKIAELKQTIDRNEPKKLWTKIDWAKDMDAGLQRAQKENKPVLVFMLVNESGRKDATRC